MNSQNKITNCLRWFPKSVHMYYYMDTYILVYPRSVDINHLVATHDLQEVMRDETLMFMCSDVWDTPQDEHTNEFKNNCTEIK